MPISHRNDPLVDSDNFDLDWRWILKEEDCSRAIERMINNPKMRFGVILIFFCLLEEINSGKTVMFYLLLFHQMVKQDDMFSSFLLRNN